MQLPDLRVSMQELLQAGFEAKGPSQAGLVLLEAWASGVLASSGASLAEQQAGSGRRECQLIPNRRNSFEHLRPGILGRLWGSWLGSGHCLWTLWLRLAALVKIMMRMRMMM